jgi:glycosyltransferase involved in cell wall biosynthesis
MDISIIICTYNGADKIEKTLASILSQKVTCTYELIIVNNASSDSTAEVVQKYLTDYQIDGFSWTLIYEPIPGLIHARLAGMKAASADIILFCDDDNILCDSYVQTGFEIMNCNPKIGVLGGLGIPEFESEKPDWFDTYYHSYAVGPQSDKDGKIQTYPAQVYGAGSFYRKLPIIYFYNNGFKSRLKGRTGKKLLAGDDVEICFLLQLSGYEIWYNKDLLFKHYMPSARLKWEYYTKMKVGIAGSDSALMPYAALFSGSKFYFLFILKHSVRKFILYAFISIKQSIIYHLCSTKKKPYLMLSKSVYWAKCASYLYSPFSAYIHIRRINRIRKSFKAI